MAKADPFLLDQINESLVGRKEGRLWKDRKEGQKRKERRRGTEMEVKDGRIGCGGGR
jgi:hypothetical protein